MKKYIYLIALIVLVIFVTLSFKSRNYKEVSLVDGTSVEKTVTPTNVEEKLQNEIVVETYTLYYVESKPNNIQLYSNIEDKLSSKNAKDKNSCEFLINAGFYDQQGRHIGLFATTDRTYSKATTSTLFNGFVFLEKESIQISTTPPETFDFAVQSGPLLFEEGKAVKLTKTQDKARRMLVLVTKKGDIVFASVYDKNLPLSGPALSELPGLLLELESKTGMKINSAINLDGGNHSAFITNEKSLSEISSIGGYFCKKT